MRNDITIHPHERVDDLHRDGHLIIQDPKRFCFGVDAVILSGFAKVKKGENVLDLGTGTGIIPILLAAKTEGKHFTGLEIQTESAEMANRSVLLNELEERVSIKEGDIKEAVQLFGASSFDVVTSNPPYMNEGGGLVNPFAAKAIARHEILCSLEDVVAAAARLLRPLGRFYMIHRPHRLTDIMVLLRQYKLEPKRIRFVQPYADSPLDEEPVAETVYLNLLARAEQYVYIYTPYLAVGEEMLDALKNAAKRGVDVRLVLPGIPDKKLVFRLSRSYYLPLLQAGVRIYEYTPGFLHAKCWVSDDRAAVVGSINMDYRSLFLHFECGVLLQYNSQVAALRDDVRATLPQCREIHISDCRTSIPGTLLDSVLRLLSPLM